jgi:ubiquinone/menaquinone biosynthesis C-methylase UbiE
VHLNPGYALCYKEVTLKNLLKIKKMKRSSPEEIESKYVNTVYDIIAPHFNHTRFCPWPSVEKWVKSLDENSTILDIGCGNGRNLGIKPKTINVGTDFSLPLCKIASQRGYPIFCASALVLPIRDESFDHVICIAVIHHFASEKRRVQCLKEIRRVLKIGGTAYVTAWSTKQRKKEYDEQDQIVPWRVRKDFDKSEPSFNRYYHLFVEGEFKTLISQVEGLEYVSESYETGNWEVTVKRTN